MVDSIVLSMDFLLLNLDSLIPLGSAMSITEKFALARSLRNPKAPNSELS